MLGYVTLGTNDMARAASFYDQLLGLIGAKRMMESDRFVAWGVSPTQPSLGVIKPFDGNAATVGNGTMISLVVDSHEKVDMLHKKALALGGKDEGAAGPRGAGFYSGYFRDLDGNKLNVFCMSQGG
ncbi:MAG: VOC family protein [Aeromicrobium sp.]|nr:VOC family protein [Burkholderiales bacterium]